MLFRSLSIVFLLSSVAWPQYRPARHGGQYMFNYYLPPAPSSTPWAPCWSPDGKWLAVAMHGSLWKVDPQTGEAAELTYGPKYHSSPAWSPDGNWVVYTADDGGKTIQLEILNIETGRTHSLTSDAHLYLDPVFSPDGGQIAYVSTQPNGHFNIIVRAIRNGQWAGEPVPLTRDNRYPRDRLYFGPWDMHTQPAWTPDGKQILFVCNRGVPLGSGDVWRMPAERDGIDRAVAVLKEQSLYRTRPDVSIDGKRFVYSSTAGAADQFNNVYVLPVEGGAPYKLTFGDHDRFHPRWSPDGEWIAYVSNKGGLPQLALLETYGGADRIIEIKSLRRKRPVGRLRLSVIEEETLRPVPARIHLLASDGKFYAPSDTYARIGNHRHFFHTSGQSTMELPPGRTTIEAVKGFEFMPVSSAIEIEPGKTTELTLTLRRLVDLSARGWQNGSTHVHMNYGGNQRGTLENLLMMSAAEDQDILVALAANKDNRVLDQQYFVPGGGEHPASKDSPYGKLIVGQEYRPPFYGHVFFLGLRDHLISPFTTGYEGTAIESLYPSNTDMFRKARAQGAVIGYVHPFSSESDPLERGLGVAKAFPVDAALGTVDALEWSAASRAQLRVWHHALNNDLPIVPVGGEDSINDLHQRVLLGAVRTYAYTGSDQSVTAWLEAIRAGRTFFSSGPLLEFRVNGKLPGDRITLPPAGGTVALEGSVWSVAPLTKVEIHSNGKTILDVPLDPTKQRAEFKRELTLTDSAWLSLYAEGPRHSAVDAGYFQAATNVVRVCVGDRKIRNGESADYFIRWIDKLKSMALEWPGWRSQKEKDHVLNQFEEARNTYWRLKSDSFSAR